MVIGWFLSGLNADTALETKESTSEEQGAPPAGGVTLVVDFGVASDRDPLIRKVETFSGTGWELFSAAGVAVTGTAEFPTGFVCRIEEFPSRVDQDCQDTPKFNEGSWAYFVTNPDLGDGWVLSGAGAATHRPNCGAFEGWLWVAPGESSGQQVPRVAAMPEKCEG